MLVKTLVGLEVTKARTLVEDVVVVIIINNIETRISVRITKAVCQHLHSQEVRLRQVKDLWTSHPWVMTLVWVRCLCHLHQSLLNKEMTASKV